MARTLKTLEPTTGRARATEKPHHTIVSIGATDGFLKGVELELVDGLNCVIGGRGTGKTSVVEFVRYALGLMPDPRTSPVRARSVAGLLEKNLGPAGRVRVEVKTKHGIRYVAERPWKDATQVYDDKGVPKAITFDRDLIFRADVYSQNEIEEIAYTPALQLALLDKFVEEDVRSVQVEAARVLRELDDNAIELLRIEGKLEELVDRSSELPAFEEKLKALESSGTADAKKINAAHTQKVLREKEKRALDALPDDLRRAVTDVAAAVQGASRRLEARIDDEVLEGPNKKGFARIREGVEALVTSLGDLLEKTQRVAEKTTEVLAEEVQGLREAHARQERDYRKLLQESEGEKERTQERAQLQAQYVEATQAKKDLEGTRKEAAEKTAKRRTLLAKISSLRDERFQLRKQVAERLTQELEPEIRVAVTQNGSRDGYRDLLLAAIQGSYVKSSTVDRIVAGTSPASLAGLLRSDNAKVFAERAGIDEEKSRKLIDLLKGKDFLYRIETVELQDLPTIELLDGKTYKGSAGLSTGQRCTTILPILLIESERPLIVDQPEDNLDNAYIFDTVVKRVRAAKKTRQLIFVTHNPNIPVLGDAERIFVLTSDGQRASLAATGTVDELKMEIETLLEGGEEAFLLRKKRYGH